MYMYQVNMVVVDTCVGYSLNGRNEDAQRRHGSAWRIQCGKAYSSAGGGAAGGVLAHTKKTSAAQHCCPSVLIVARLPPLEKKRNIIDIAYREDLFEYTQT